MPPDTSTISAPETTHAETYTFENETELYSLDSQFDKGKEFQALSFGPEKIKFLQEYGRQTKKETRQDKRIMISKKGAWRFYNVGQLEYMFRADDDDDSESALERQCKEIERVEEKKEFFLKNATRIREWPERIQRVENLV